MIIINLIEFLLVFLVHSFGPFPPYNDGNNDWIKCIFTHLQLENVPGIEWEIIYFHLEFIYKPTLHYSLKIVRNC